MVKCAKEMMDPSVIQTINQGVVPVGTEMGALGGQSDSWRNKEGGGGYSATVPPAEGSNICTTYGGSTKAFKRRLPEQHFSQTYRDKYPNNELYKAMSTGRQTVWNTVFELTPRSASTTSGARCARSFWSFLCWHSLLYTAHATSIGSSMRFRLRSSGLAIRCRLERKWRPSICILCNSRIVLA